MTAHTIHQMHCNSLAAYATLDLKGRKKQIVECLANVGHPLTDRQIAAYYNKTRDAYQPRVSDLIEDTVLVEVDRVECPFTGHLVRRVWFAESTPTMVSVGESDAHGEFTP